MNICACGCGQPCKKKYLNHHFKRSKESYQKGVETREKNGLRLLSDETKEKIRKKAIGRKPTEESNLKRSLKLKGISKNKGLAHTKEHIEKRVEKLKGQKRTEEQKQNIRNALKGKQKTKEHIENMLKSRVYCKLTEEHKQKISESLYKTYSNKNTLKELTYKIYQTKKRNNSFNTSKPEKELHNLLLQNYPDVIKEYKDFNRYPFNCDFYIPSLDLFIELNNFFIHGKEPYNEKNKKHLDLKNKILSKTNLNKKNLYNAFYKIWTQKDVYKRNIALLNKINYLEIYSYNNLNDILLVIDKFKNKELNYFYLTKNFLFKNNLELNFKKENLLKEIDILNNKKEINYDSTITNSIILNFQKSFYDKEKDLWQNFSIRNKLINNRLYFLDKKSSNSLSDYELLSGFKKSGIHYGYSHFSPFIIKTFIKEFNIKSILDICGGWGHRYLGSLDIDYIYNDIDINKYKDTKNIHNFITENNLLNSNINKIFLNKDCSEYNFNNLNYECVFTCPPYYNLENHNRTQFNYESWLNIWWRKSIKNSINKNLKYFAFVINNKLLADMKNICIEENLIHYKDIILQKNKSHFSKNKTYEILTIFKL